MVHQNVGGVGVTNSSGQLVSNLSLRDLKIINKDEKLFTRLYKTTGEFLDDLVTLNEKRFKNVKTVTVDNTFEDVLDQLYLLDIHRTYIVDEEKKPIGVIGIKDIIREVLFDS